MSSDDGIYIVKFPDGYRVVHAQAIENIDYFPVGSKERKAELKEYFGESKVYSTKEEAILEAHKLAEEILKEYGILEYGVQYLGDYEDFSSKNILI